ncbi:hypothetical protein BKA80DRAFT_289862 [Phyllosticta citrichinensis]
MKKTLLLVFIHGFKGGDDTFGKFPQHLRAVVSNARPKISVEVATYPKYETRGDLRECVTRFREWLQNKVIDLEVANGTPSPTVDPSVRVVLCGHSMGGIVAAETILSITNDQPIQTDASESDPSVSSSTLMFPYIQGILAFDTPYLGIAPGVVAHGAEGQWNAATAAYSAYTSMASTFGMGKKQPPDPGAVEASKMLPAASTAAAATAAAASDDPNRDTAKVPGWQKWGKIAMFAGAAGAVAAAGGAAWMNREQISEGWQFVGSHLEFVGCLARGEELKKRLASVAALCESQGLGFADLYTQLAVDAQGKATQWAAGVVGDRRTFCVTPKSEIQKHFIPIVNEKATAETAAHVAMFEPKAHPGYYAMGELSKELIVDWTSNAWYEEATGYESPNRRGSGSYADDQPVDDDVELVEKPDVDQTDYDDLAESILKYRNKA